jgi:plastocyanin
VEEAVFEVARDRKETSVATRAALAAVVTVIAVLMFSGPAWAQAAAVDFSYSPAAPTAGEPVTFTSTSSLQRPIARESWDFDGDGRVDASARSVTHRFASPGTYTVTLQVRNDRGRVRSTSKPVTVSAPAPAQPPATPPPAPPPPEPPPPSPTTSSAIPIPPADPMPPPTVSATGAAPISPFPVVRITGSYTGRGVRLRLLTITAPAGVRITVRCRGRGCPKLRRGPLVVRASGTGPVGAAQYVRIRGFHGRLLRPGVRLQIFVAHQDRIGKYTSFRIRRGNPPLRTDTCLRPGTATTFQRQAC